MAVFRQIQTTYWQDPFVEGLTPTLKTLKGKNVSKGR